ncbi:MAG: RagB/SusD family nutrient uptake outer membrane protein [Balneolaceae bacterium]|nr:MAG: RagB/SusD family nutrient uptake outer membrane protein [Balneolaceae bacterium]
MKKFKHIFIALIIGAAFSGCDDLLDLEPQASISDEIALSTPDNVETALIGGYASLGASNAYGGHYIFLTDIFAAPADEIFFNGTFTQPREVNAKSILIDNSYMAGYWSTSFNIINRTNNVLDALDVFGNDTARRTRVEAEARFLRATAYYNLIVAYGKAYNDGNPQNNPGVPIIVTPTRVADETLEVERASVAEVYDFVLSDLTFARDNLPATNGFLANTYVASAMLSRVYLSMGNFAQAGAQAQRIIESGNYALFPNISENYVRVQNGSETIFAIQNTETTFSNDMAVFYAPTSSFGRADVQVRDIHLENYEPGDARAELFVETARGRMTLKYASLDPSVDPRRRNITVLRLAEMHLIRAEVNYRLTGAGNPGIGGATPEDDINAIRARVGLDPLPSVTLAQVLQERRNELMFEGQLLNDLKRLEGFTVDLNDEQVPWNSNRMVFPIPEREMNVNSRLVQNDGY